MAENAFCPACKTTQLTSETETICGDCSKKEILPHLPVILGMFLMYLTAMIILKEYTYIPRPVIPTLICLHFLVNKGISRKGKMKRKVEVIYGYSFVLFAYGLNIFNLMR